jgi:hypothetical protein
MRVCAHEACIEVSAQVHFLEDLLIFSDAPGILSILKITSDIRPSDLLLSLIAHDSFKAPADHCILRLLHIC